MLYTENLVEEIRMNNDIVEVISSYVRLQKKGNTHFGLCPFHNEKTPSFSVVPNKQMFYCFGCGEGGNVISFIMKYENFTFIESLKLLADRAGIDLPELEYSKEAKQQADLKAIILEINNIAAKYFYYQLKSERGENAYQYLKDRELSEETIIKFGLGYSNKYSNDLYKYLKEMGYNDEVLKETGLVSIEEKGSHDKFWNRVMFPIFDVNSRVIAFGGRVMGEGSPKYLNSPETKVFDKSRNLYGLNLARVSRKPYLIICEGYMDVIALHQSGFNNAVASLGTALTSGHAMLLKRYTDQVILSYDSDDAGIKATLRAIPTLKNVGLSIKVINLKPYKDPDDFIKNLGVEAFEKRIDEAANSFLFEISVIKNNFDMKNPESKTSFFKEVAKRLLEFESELERDNYIEAVSKEFFIPNDNLKKLVNKLALSYDGASTYERPKQAITSKKDKDDGVKKSQRILLTWLIEDTNLYSKVSKVISAEDFIEPLYNKVANLLFTQIENGEVNPAKIINHFESEEEHKEAASLFNTLLSPNLTKDERQKALNETIIKVKRNSLDYLASRAVDINVLQNIIEEKTKLQKMHISID